GHQVVVWWLVSSWSGSGWRGSGHGVLLHGHVGMQVNLCGLDTFVSGPERDDGDVDSGGQQPHRGGVPEHVWGDRFGGQARAEHRGGRGVQFQAGSDGVATNLGSCAGRKYESFSVTWPFGGERLEDVYGLSVQGCGSVLAAFAVLCRALVYAEQRFGELEMPCQVRESGLGDVGQ